jgi:hypothetical protein
LCCTHALAHLRLVGLQVLHVLKLLGDAVEARLDSGGSFLLCLGASLRHSALLGAHGNEPHTRAFPPLAEGNAWVKFAFQRKKLFGNFSICSG